MPWESSGCLGRHRESKSFFYFLFVLDGPRQASAGRNFMAQLRTRARFPRSMLEIHRFFTGEMKTGKPKCCTVCVPFLRPLIFCKEMPAQSQLVRDVWAKSCFSIRERGAPRVTGKKGQFW